MTAAAARAALALAVVCATAGVALAVQFGPLQTLQSGIVGCAGVVVGPEDPDPASTGDGCVYALAPFSGAVWRTCFDAAKAVTSTGVVIDLNGGANVNALLGAAFDPASDPAGAMHLYLAYAKTNTAPFEGRIARAVSADGGQSWTVDEGFVTGLPRSAFDHQTNGLAFGADGCLYVAQGNGSNAGYDSAWAESRLSSAVLRVCFKDPGGGVDPAFDRDCGSGWTQEACSVEVFASGLRNPFDLVWHSNGRLYATDNDANQGFRDNCPAAANTFGCACQVPPVEPIGDEIHLIEAGSYYGSPNPYRAYPDTLQCAGGTGATRACTTDADCPGGGTCTDLGALCVDAVCGESVQCFYFGYGHSPEPGEDPLGLYHEPIAQVAALLDGMAEYRAPWAARLPGAFCSDWDAQLLIAGGPGSVRRVTLSPDGLAATHAGTANLNGLTGLDVAVGPDGTVYAADFNGGRVRYVVPVAQPDPMSGEFFVACAAGEICDAGACVSAVDGDGDGVTAPADCDDDDPAVFPGAPETCNGRDDDCDLAVDETPVGSGVPCSTGLAGVCDAGTMECVDTVLACVQSAFPGAEACNGLDDDCDAAVDEDDPGGGGACATGALGACGQGILACTDGALACEPTVSASDEACATGVDEDCDGETDEDDCQWCPAAGTVWRDDQTHLTRVRTSDRDGRGRVASAGRFVQAAAGQIDPVTQDVTLRLRDGAGAYYETTIPAGAFVASGRGRVFTFKDPSQTHHGLKLAKLRVQGDGVTVKYLFKAEGLDLAAPTSGDGGAEVRVGGACWVDPTEVCTLTASARGLACR